MKPKLLYVSCIVLIIVILIIILIIRQNLKIQPVPEEIKPQEEAAQEQNVVTDYTQHLPSASGNRPAITIIKKPSFEKKMTPAVKEAEHRLKESRRAEKPSASSRQSPAVAEGGPEELPASSTSGVTKIGKHPTEKENKEMNTRGIVMY